MACGFLLKSDSGFISPPSDGTWTFQGYYPLGSDVNPTTAEFTGTPVSSPASSPYDYNIGDVVGSSDNPSIDISALPNGFYVFQYDWSSQCNTYSNNLVLEVLSLCSQGNSFDNALITYDYCHIIGTTEPIFNANVELGSNLNGCSGLTPGGIWKVESNGSNNSAKAYVDNNNLFDSTTGELSNIQDIYGQVNGDFNLAMSYSLTNLATFSAFSTNPTQNGQDPCASCVAAIVLRVRGVRTPVLNSTAGTSLDPITPGISPANYDSSDASSEGTYFSPASIFDNLPIQAPLYYGEGNDVTSSPFTLYNGVISSDTVKVFTSFNGGYQPYIGSASGGDIEQGGRVYSNIGSSGTWSAVGGSTDFYMDIDDLPPGMHAFHYCDEDATNTDNFNPCRACKTFYIDNTENNCSSIDINPITVIDNGNNTITFTVDNADCSGQSRLTITDPFNTVTGPVFENTLVVNNNEWGDYLIELSCDGCDVSENYTYCGDLENQVQIVPQIGQENILEVSVDTSLCSAGSNNVTYAWYINSDTSTLLGSQSTYDTQGVNGFYEVTVTCGNCSFTDGFSFNGCDWGLDVDFNDATNDLTLGPGPNAECKFPSDHPSTPNQDSNVSYDVSVVVNTSGTTVSVDSGILAPVLYSKVINMPSLTNVFARNGVYYVTSECAPTTDVCETSERFVWCITEDDMNITLGVEGDNVRVTIELNNESHLYLESAYMSYVQNTNPYDTFTSASGQTSTSNITPFINSGNQYTFIFAPDEGIETPLTFRLEPRYTDYTTNPDITLICNTIEVDFDGCDVQATMNWGGPGLLMSANDITNCPPATSVVWFDSGQGQFHTGPSVAWKDGPIITTISCGNGCDNYFANLNCATVDVTDLSISGSQLTIDWQVNTLLTSDIVIRYSWENSNNPGVWLNEATTTTIGSNPATASATFTVSSGIIRVRYRIEYNSITGFDQDQVDNVCPWEYSQQVSGANCSSITTNSVVLNSQPDMVLEMDGCSGTVNYTINHYLQDALPTSLGTSAATASYSTPYVYGRVDGSTYCVNLNGCGTSAAVMNCSTIVSIEGQSLAPDQYELTFNIDPADNVADEVVYTVVPVTGSDINGTATISVTSPNRIATVIVDPGGDGTIDVTARVEYPAGNPNITYNPATCPEITEAFVTCVLDTLNLTVTGVDNEFIEADLVGCSPTMNITWSGFNQTTGAPITDSETNQSVPFNIPFTFGYTNVNTTCNDGSTCTVSNGILNCPPAATITYNDIGNDDYAIAISQQDGSTSPFIPAANMPVTIQWETYLGTVSGNPIESGNIVLASETGNTDGQTASQILTYNQGPGTYIFRYRYIYEDNFNNQYFCDWYEDNYVIGSAQDCSGLNFSATFVSDPMTASLTGCSGTPSYLWTTYNSSGMEINPTTATTPFSIGFIEVTVTCDSSGSDDGCTETFSQLNCPTVTASFQVIDITNMSITFTNQGLDNYPFVINWTLYDAHGGSGSVITSGSDTMPVGQSDLVISPITPGIQGNISVVYTIRFTIEGVIYDCPITNTYDGQFITDQVDVTINQLSSSSFSASTSGSGNSCQGSISYQWVNALGNNDGTSQNYNANEPGPFTVTATCSSSGVFDTKSLFSCTDSDTVRSFNPSLIGSTSSATITHTASSPYFENILLYEIRTEYSYVSSSGFNGLSSSSSMAAVNIPGVLSNVSFDLSQGSNPYVPGTSIWGLDLSNNPILTNHPVGVLGINRYKSRINYHDPLNTNDTDFAQCDLDYDVTHDVLLCNNHLGNSWDASSFNLRAQGSGFVTANLDIPAFKDPTGSLTYVLNVTGTVSINGASSQTFRVLYSNNQNISNNTREYILTDPSGNLIAFNSGDTVDITLTASSNGQICTWTLPQLVV